MKQELAKNICKIKYSEEGYLPYYPYHMISDSEMVDAFIFNKSNFFSDNYPMPCESLREDYESLKSFIQRECEKLALGASETLPNWIWTYMLGYVVGPESPQKDVHDLLVGLNLDNLYDEFNESVYKSILEVSKSALGALSAKPNGKDLERPCAMFGEPHVIKYLRLEQAGVN